MNPFSWLPRTGRFARIPGGVLWCQEWKITENRSGVVEGEIVFKFTCDKAEYHRAAAEAAESARLLDRANTLTVPPGLAIETPRNPPPP